MRDEDRRRRRLAQSHPARAIVAVLALTGMASSLMFTLVVPIQAKLPELLDASRDDTAWVVEASFDEAVGDVFLVTTPLAAIAVIAVVFLPNIPLSTTTNAQRLADQQGGLCPRGLSPMKQ